MAQHPVEINQLPGQERNPVRGERLTEGQPIPSRIFNLVPDRMGGYVPYGRRSRLNSIAGGGGTDVTLPDIERLVGFDETGISSYLNSAGTEMSLFRRRTIHNQALPAYSASDLATGENGPLVHLDGAGAYAGRDAFLVFGRDNHLVEPIDSEVSPIGNAGSPLERNDLPTAFVDVAYGGGDLMAVSTRAIWRRATDGTWEEVYTEADSNKGNFRRIAYGAGTWLAPQARLGDHAPFQIMRSTDGGDNWSNVDPYAPGGLATGSRLNPYSIDFRAGVWTIGGRGLWTGDIGGDGQSALTRSSDGGVTWGGYTMLSSTRGRLSDIATSPDSGFWATADYVPTQRADPWVSWDGGDWAAYWLTPGGAPGVAPGDSHRVYPRANRLVWVSGDSFLAFHENGRISTGRLVYPGLAFPASHPMGQSTALTDGSGEVKVNDVGIDHATKTVIAVGQFTPAGGGATEARVWSSIDLGVTWTRLSEVEAALEDAVLIVAIDDDGHAWYFTATREVNAGTRTGLVSGSYNVYALSYFNTPAGRLVYDLTRVAIASEDGGFITFQATGRAEIAARNPWMSSGLIEDLRFDIYIQRVAEPIDGVDIENTIRYAFTEPFPEGTGMVDLGRQIDALPLGRQLLVHGQATTSVWEQNRTAIHNGRVWGMANQNEDHWHVDGDHISPEIANQFNRFVLSYTEVGWANLMSDRSFIPIQPTQSTRFTGLVSTPSGLLVMFDNEVFLVTGDPAFGNVSVELYLDMAGCDDGTYPCKVGGIPFAIWTGKVWALQAGQAQEVGVGQWLSEDRFVRIAPEPQTRSILALTASGQVLRYVLDHQFWLTDAVNRDGLPIREMLPNCNCESGDNTRFVLDAPALGQVWSTRRDGDPDVPHIVYRDFDAGIPERRKGIYLVKLTFEGDVLTEEYDRSDGGYDPEAIPGLIWATGNERNGWTWEELAAQTGGVEPVMGDLVGRKVGTMSFRLPLRRTRSFTHDLRLELRGMRRYDVLKLPLRLYVSAGGETR